MSPEEWAVRVDLAAAYKLIAHYGWTDMASTHLSARVPGPEHHFLLNPHGLFFDEITASSLVKVDVEGRVVTPTEYDVNPAGFVIHSAVHMAQERNSCVIHTHTPAGVGVATQKGGLLPITQHSLAILPHVGYHDFEGIAVNLGERERIVRDLGDGKILFLRNHGILAVGETVADAFMTTYRAERACRMQLAFQSAGVESYPIPPEVQELTMQQVRSFLSPSSRMGAGKLEWPALLRMLDRLDPSYKQ